MLPTAPIIEFDIFGIKWVTVNTMHTDEYERNHDILEFTIFCIENVATKISMGPAETYRLLRDSGLIHSYIICHYDILHTQGKEYVVNDICEVMKDRGLIQ